MDQSEADSDLSAKQRLGLAAGSTLQGAAGFAGDIEPLADALDVAGNTLQFRLHSLLVSVYFQSVWVCFSFWLGSN